MTKKKRDLSDLKMAHGFPKHMWRTLYRQRNKTYQPPYHRDTPNGCTFGSLYWEEYDGPEYDYQFNSWGYRGQDYEQYLGKKVNICIGDSFTMNMGGPIEDSWPSQLSKYFDIPTLTFAAPKADYTLFAVSIERAYEMFEPQHIFVLNNLFEDEERFKVNDSGVMEYIHQDVHAGIKTFKDNFYIHGAHYQFDPPWCWRDEELPDLYKHFPDAHDYVKMTKFTLADINVKQLMLVDSLVTSYSAMAGKDWIPYSKFCEAYCLGENVLDYFRDSGDKLQIKEFLVRFKQTVQRVLYTNRDGWHMSKKVNENLAKKFYQMSQGQNLIVP